jgi:hypothetical protein
MSDLEQRLRETSIKVHELVGWDDEHRAIMDARDYIDELEAQCEAYEAIGERVAAQNGNWLLLHKAAFEWMHGEFKRIKEMT